MLVLGFRVAIVDGTRKNSPLRSSSLELKSGCGASASHALYSRTRSEATKSPFYKGGFRGTVNIFYSFRVCLFSGLGLPRRGTRKNSPLRSSLLETERETIFYCNSRKAILNSQRHTRKTQFCRKLFARPAFSRKSGQYCVA